LSGGGDALPLSPDHLHHQPALFRVGWVEQNRTFTVAILVDHAAGGLKSATGTGPKPGAGAVGHEQDSKDAIGVEVNLSVPAFDDRLSILSPADAQQVLACKMLYACHVRSFVLREVRSTLPMTVSSSL
jgi:hypothetical protein